MSNIDYSKLITTVAKAAQAKAALLATFRGAVQAHIDATAQQRQYDSGLSVATYVTSTIQRWAIEAAVFVAWRDAVWAYALAELDKVLAGERQQPTLEAFIAELPPMIWPA